MENINNNTVTVPKCGCGNVPTIAVGYNTHENKEGFLTKGYPFVSYECECGTYLEFDGTTIESCLANLCQTIDGDLVTTTIHREVTLP